MIIITSSDRRCVVPGEDFVFGVEADAGSETKRFQCPRYVGNNLDLAGSLIRINYRNANGDIDSYLVNDVTIDGDNVVFTWVLSPKVVMYKGQVKFVVCVVGADTKVKWHTTLATGRVLEGLEPDNAMVEEGTADVVAQLIAMVEAQTVAVENTGETWVANVKSEGATQVNAVKAAAEAAEAAAVAEIEAKGVNTLASIPEDYTALSKAVRGLAGAIVCEAEGEVVTLSDSSNLPMQGLRIFGRSTQDGTPTPEAPVEIVSVENPAVTVYGKNLCSVNSASFEQSKRYQLDVTIPAGSYFFSCIAESNDTDAVTCLVGFYRGDSRVASIQVERGERVVCQLELTDDVESIHLYAATMHSEGIGDTASFSDIMIATFECDYEPYSGQTLALTHTLPGIPVTSGGNYTDSDGQQWICDEVDLERGVYVQRVNVRKLTGTESFEDFVLESGVVTLAIPHKDESNFISSHGLCGECVYWANSSRIAFRVAHFGVSTKQDFKTVVTESYNAGAPITIYYVLATPIETPLSETEIAAYRALHTNKPNTTVLNDAGAHMAVKYVADTKLYIDNKIAALTV